MTWDFSNEKNEGEKEMNQIMSILESLIDNPLFHEVAINIIGTIITYPFMKGFVKKAVNNRKKMRMKQAWEELSMECIKKLFTKDSVSRKEVDYLIQLIAHKNKLNISDLAENREDFEKKLIGEIANKDFIDYSMKGKLLDIIKGNRDDEEDLEAVRIHALYKSICSKYESAEWFENERVFAKENEKSYIRKLTLIFTCFIFIVGLLATNIIQVLYESCGVISFVYLNGIVSVFAILPILGNGIYSYDNLDRQGRRLFYLLILVLFLTIINFIAAASIIL